MVYMTVKYTSQEIEFLSVVVSKEEFNFTSFPAVIGNPNYDQFLEQAGLTDVEVHELEPDVWYDFPELPAS